MKEDPQVMRVSEKHLYEPDPPKNNDHTLHIHKISDTRVI